MDREFAPPPVLFAALRTLHRAAYTTRNWTLDDTVSRKQINDLWEAIHEIPDLLTHWRGDDSEKELLLYLHEYAEKWKEPDLLVFYRSHLDL